MDGFELLQYSENFPEKSIEIKQAGNLAQLSINGMIPIKIEAMSTATEKGQDIDILDDSGAQVGYLCPVKTGLSVLIESMTEAQYSCFLLEATIDEATSGAMEHRFASDYAVILDERIDEYNEKYKNSSTLWGHFTHICSPPPHTRKSSSVTAFQAINISQHHQDGLTRACEASNSFERFLKLYHQLELLFDFIFVARIKSLNKDLKGFSDIIKNYNREEAATLKSLISSSLTHPTKLEAIFLRATAHEKLFKSIFQEYGKESNPLKDENRFSVFWTQAVSGAITHADLKKIPGQKTQDDHNNLLCNLAGYWIYRIRCCIAHNKIGEYIISQSDEEFLVDFGEEIIREILNQVYTNKSLESLLSK